MEKWKVSDRCKTCNRPVIWAKNDKTGKAAPIDAAPDEEGNIVLLSGGLYHVLTKAERVMVPIKFGDIDLSSKRYTPHWQTCPDRQAWKDKQR